MRRIFLALFALLIGHGGQTPVFAKPVKRAAEVAQAVIRKPLGACSPAGKPSAVMEVLLALEQVGRDYATFQNKFGPARASKLIDERVAKIVSKLKSPDQVGLMAVQGASLNRSANYLEDLSWDDLGHSVYIACLDRLSKDRTLAAQRALRRVAESLRGDVFFTHNADMWIQAAMLQNGDRGDFSKSAWYLEQVLIQKYSGTEPDEFLRLKEQMRRDIKDHVKVPENIAPSDL
ncbi:MAG: hypothetical protein WC028_29490 [Candidatus Obscuribacterales bacterium]